MEGPHEILEIRRSWVAVVLLAASLWPLPSDPGRAVVDVVVQASAGTSHRVPVVPECPRGRVVVIAHRGTGDGTRKIDGRTFSENTVPAFRKAMAEGVDGVEADYWTTSDGAVVTHHDATADRMTDGSGPIARLTRDDVRRLRNPSGAAVPGHEELGTVLRPYGGHRQQEIKDGDRFPARTLRRMIDHDLRQTSYGRLLYASSDVGTLRRVTAIDRRVRVGLIHRSNLGRPLLAALPRWVDVVLIHRGAADADYVARARDMGIEVSLRRVETVSQLHRAVALGAARVVTDRPELLGAAC